MPRDPTEGKAVVESQEYVYASKDVCRAASNTAGDLAGSVRSTQAGELQYAMRTILTIMYKGLSGKEDCM